MPLTAGWLLNRSSFYCL